MIIVDYFNMHVCIYSYRGFCTLVVMINNNNNNNIACNIKYDIFGYAVKAVPPFWNSRFWSTYGNGVGTGASATNLHRGGCPLQTIEGNNIIIIMLLSTKAVFQVNKDPGPLHE